MAGKVIEVTDENFEEIVLKSPIPVLVEYYAEWCEPCKIMALNVDQFAKDAEDKIKVVKVSVDYATENRGGLIHTLVKAGLVRPGGIPTLIMFQNGEAVLHEKGNNESFMSGTQSPKKIGGWVNEMVGVGGYVTPNPKQYKTPIGPNLPDPSPA